MNGVSNCKPTSYELERAADEMILKSQNHNAYTEIQIKRRKRQERESLGRYITQSDPTIDSRNYLRHAELQHIIKHAHLNKRELIFIDLYLRDLSIREIGIQINIKHSSAYDLYNKILVKLRAAAVLSPYNGLINAYCDDISRCPVKRMRCVNNDREDDAETVW